MKEYHKIETLLDRMGRRVIVKIKVRDFAEDVR